MTDRVSETTPTSPAFDEELLRHVAGQVIADLPGSVVENFAKRFTTSSELTEAMIVRGSQVWRHLERRDRGVPHDSYPLFAVALLSVRTKPFDVQRNPTNVVTQYDRLVAYGDVPIDVAVQSRLIRDDLADRLITASRVSRLVRAERPATPPFFVGMVTCAVLGLLGEHVADPVGEVLSVFSRADRLAARHRSRLLVEEGPSARFPVLGNADIVGQVAAYRVAIAEQAGLAVGDTDEVVRDHADKVAARLHRAMTRPLSRSTWAGGDEPDAVLGIRGFAAFIAADAADGGADAAEVFQWLHPELSGLSNSPWRNVTPVGHDEDLAPFRGDPAVDADAELDADVVAGWVLAELYSNTTARDQDVLDTWLVGTRVLDSQDDLLFLVDRVRRVDRRMANMPPKPSSFHDRSRAGSARVRARVADALALRLDGREIAQGVLPPLWTARAAAIGYVVAHLRTRLPGGVSNVAKSTLLASIAVRAPAQQVHRASTPATDTRCACDNAPDRAPWPPSIVCPHRGWLEPGRVENYTTLAETAGLTTEAATRHHLKRYSGFWEEWIAEVLAEKQ